MDGLRDVVAAETVLSDVDGAAGRLIIRGFTLDELAGRVSYEAACHLLLDGMIDGLPADADGLRQRLGAARVQAFREVAALDAELRRRPPLDAVRALMARLPDGDDLDVALRLLAAPAVFAPAVIRAGRGLEPSAPDASLGHAADMLRMLKGDAPAPAEVRPARVEAATRAAKVEAFRPWSMMVTR